MENLKIALSAACAAVVFGFTAAAGDCGTVVKSDTVMVPKVDDRRASVSLDGVWTVARWPFKASEETLASPACDDSGWERRRQPGKVFYWNFETSKQWPTNFNHVTLAHIDERDGAVIRRRVGIPAEWRGKRIFLRFDAVYPAAVHYLNGRRLGEHMSGLTPVQYDVTDVVRPGEEALVAVRLHRRHKFCQLDMVRQAIEFGGLAQSARFFAVEPLHIADYHLVSSLSEDLATGSVEGRVWVRNASGEARRGRLSVELRDRRGKVVASREAEVDCAAGATVELQAGLRLEKPLLWNDEKPNLYQVRLALSADGEAPQAVTFATGFRRFDFSRARGARLNGNPVKFRGVNHLTFSPDGGLYTSKDFLRKSLTLMKRANVNCIRTHFSGPEALQELCDEMGFYLMQEIPIDWGTHYIHLDEWMPPALMRIEAVVRRDRHHPSLVAWSVGNENMPESNEVAARGWGNLQKFEDLCHRLDPAHDTMFPPPGPANKITANLELRYGEIGDTHYSFRHAKELVATGKCRNPYSWEAEKRPDDPKSFYEITAEEAERGGWKGVWFSSEWGIFNNMPDILRGAYGDVLSDEPVDILSEDGTAEAFARRFDREWSFMRDEKTCLGGAYFPWLCGGAGERRDSNPWGFVAWGEAADWGVVTADLLPKPTFWVMRKAYSPIVLPKRLFVRPGAKSVRFEILNRYNSIDLKDCQLRVNREAAGSWMSQMRTYKAIPMPSTRPGESCEVELPFSDEQLDALAKSGDRNGFAFFRMWFLDPDGFRPILEDLMVFPESRRAEFERGRRKTDEVKTTKDFIPIGPDGERD